MNRDDALPVAATRARRCVGRTCLLALIGLAGWSSAHAACQVESLELPVRMVGSRAVAMVGINGTQVPMTVDSGAFFSMLTDAAAAQLKLPLKQAFNLRVEGITGRVDAQTTTVDKLQLLKGEIERVQFIVGGNEPGAGTMGLLGRNILATTDTEYDLAHGVIRFLFPNDDCRKANMAYWAGDTPVTEIDLLDEDRTKTPSIRANVKLNGTTLVALFDTGASTIVTARAARRAGADDADRKIVGNVYGVGSGSTAQWISSFARFELGGEAILNNRLRVADFDVGNADLLLGIDFFLAHRIYISKKQSKMYLTYNGGPVFALDPGVVRDTTASSPAAEGGETATADALARRGAASAARHDYAGALADLDRACELEPTSAAYLVQRGIVRQALKRPAEALADFDRALTLDPAQEDARLHRVALRIQAKEIDGAIADLDALDRTLAPQAPTRLVMAQAYLTLERPAPALAQFDQWLPAHPNDMARGTALNGRCWSRALLGTDLDRALADCDDAVDRAPTNAAYLDSRGWVQLRLGNDRKALDDFDRSVESRPANAMALYGRGLAKTRLGDAAAGDADFAAARRLQPGLDLRLQRLGLPIASMSKP